MYGLVDVISEQLRFSIALVKAHKNGSHSVPRFGCILCLKNSKPGGTRTRHKMENQYLRKVIKHAENEPETG